MGIQQANNQQKCFYITSHHLLLTLLGDSKSLLFLGEAVIIVTTSQAFCQHLRQWD
jgi:hypothetical protein